MIDEEGTTDEAQEDAAFEAVATPPLEEDDPPVVDAVHYIIDYFKDKTDNKSQTIVAKCHHILKLIG